MAGWRAEPVGAALAWHRERQPPRPGGALRGCRRRSRRSRAFALGGAALWLLWPAVSLALVAANYAVFGAGGFQKGPDGRMSLAALALLAPYLIGAWINSRLWTCRDDEAAAVGDGVFIGRNPWPTRRQGVCRGRRSVRGIARVRRVANNTRCSISSHRRPESLAAAATTIEQARAAGPVLVCCALGYGRSAAAVAAWLMATGRATSVEEAVDRIRRARPRVVLDRDALAAVAQAARLA